MLTRKLNKFVSKDIGFYFKNNQFNKIFVRSIITPKVNQDAEQDIIVKSPLPSLTYPKMTLDQYVWKDYDKWINKTAIVDGITDRSITYGQLRDRCRALAVRLRTSLNLKSKDTIAICLPNSIEFPIVALGACEADIIVTTINPIYNSDEISRQLIDSNSKVIFGEANNSAILKEAIQKTKRQIKIVYSTEAESDSIPNDGIKLNELIDTTGLDLSTLPDIHHNEASVAFLPYSSGTTGLSKGVMLSHANIISNCTAFRGEEVGITFDAIGDHQDVLPCVLPFFHIAGLVGTFLSKISQGCKLVTLPRFHPDTFLDALMKHKANALPVAPPIIVFFNSYDKVRPEHTQHVRIVVSGAAPLGVSDVENFLKIAPQAKFIQCYGLTETSPITHFMLKDSKNYGSVGKPIYDTESKVVEIDDLNYRGLGPNKSGEIFVRGPQVMIGYHNNPKATKETITSDGWLKTGDIGYYDESGDFYITDRLKELIKVKGFQVAPAELEEILRSHPEITDAAVIGIPNTATGELPRAYIVTRKDSELNERNVQEFVSEKVSEYKRLTGGVEFVESIPKNATGKILRRELKKKFD